MPTKVLALHVPADVLEQIDDLSRRQCLSRSAAVRLILINEIQRRRLEADDAQPEAAA
jgi:metal-responsive CopG/Arc/MetJ family transcriptional regulator